MDDNKIIIELLREISAKLDNIGLSQNIVMPVVGSAAPACAYTVFSWLDEWYREYKVPELTKNGEIPEKQSAGLRSIEICIRLHIKGNMTDKPLNELTALEMQQTVNKIKSSRMKKYSYETFCAAVHQAYCNDLIPVDISTKTQKVSHEREIGRALTCDEETEFLRIIKGHKLEKVFLFYLVSGVRKSEITRIKWEHVDLDNNRIFIDGTKTKTSKRWLPIFDDIYKILRQLPRNTEYLFPMPLYTIVNTFRYWQNRYKLTYPLKSLRHTFATRHYENKVPLKVVHKWMGHKNSTITENVYTHIQDEFEFEMFQLANKARKIIA